MTGMNYAISYVSTADINLTSEQIDEVLSWSENWNNTHHIKGLLLYSDGNFLQVIEGNKEIILKLFEGIKKDPRHHNIIKIFGKEIAAGSFDDYKSDFLSEHRKYDEETLSRYLNNIQTLDQGSQKVVQTMLNAFVN